VLGRKIQQSNDLTQQLETLMERNKQEHQRDHQHEELPSSRILRTQRRNELLEEKKPTKVKFQKRKMKQVKQREQRRTMMELYRYPEPEYDTNQNVNENMSIEEELEKLLISRKGRRSTEKVEATGIRGLEQYTNDNFEYPDRDDDLDDDSMMMMEELGMTLYDINEKIDTESSLLSSPLPEDENDNDIDMNNMNIDIDINSDEMYQDDEQEEYYDDEKEIASQKEPQSYKQRQQQQNNPLSQIGLQFQDIDLYVTDKDIINELGIQGGKEELLQILVQGSIAKQTMIKSNIKLVTSIAKKWYRGATVAQQNDNNRNRRKQDPSAMYGGSWSIPSLDEAIQQGIIGLSQAATRFEPARNFKFSTYATYYITNEIRQLFLSTKTGCLYVPQHFFTIRNKYQKLVEETYREHNSNTNTNSNTNDESAAPTTAGVLDLQTAAYKLKIPNPERLQFILKATESLLQLDAPITGSSGSTTSGGSSGSANPGNNNGGGNGGDATITYGEMLECDEPTSESIVERSLLRQCIENALAAELSPHERDIVRLRHGLDDGVSKTIKQIRESYYYGDSSINIGNNSTSSSTPHHPQPQISLAYIRTVEKSAYKKLRFPYSIHNARLRDFAPKYAGISPDRLEPKMLYENQQ